MGDKKKVWKVGVTYERYGYINVDAGSREEAIEKAQAELAKMSTQELDAVTSYLPDSEAVDEEFVEECPLK